MINWKMLRNSKKKLYYIIIQKFALFFRMIYLKKRSLRGKIKNYKFKIITCNVLFNKENLFQIVKKLILVLTRVTQ